MYVRACVRARMRIGAVCVNVGLYDIYINKFAVISISANLNRESRHRR